MSWIAQQREARARARWLRELYATLVGREDEDFGFCRIEIRWPDYRAHLARPFDWQIDS